MDPVGGVLELMGPYPFPDDTACVWPTLVTTEAAGPFRHAHASIPREMLRDRSWSWFFELYTAYHVRVDQLAVAPGAPTASPPRSRADETMRRLLRVPENKAPIDESETHRIFSASILLSAARCLLSYIVLPFVLPAIGIARGVGPAIGIPIGILALSFDYIGIRRFWLANHRQRWAFTALYAVVGTMVLSLVIVDIVNAIG
jgi:hypothetical protein